MGMTVGIDVGGSTTKIVGFDRSKLIDPILVKADDPIASVYGGFGKFTSENGISIADIERVMVTGVGSTFLGDDIYGLPTFRVDEFRANGRGGLYLSGLDEAVIVSMGTGTAFVYANGKKSQWEHIGGTGVGGGTLVGLGGKLLDVRSARHISALAEGGDLSKIDLRVGDISHSRAMPTLSASATASNFGNISDLAEKKDIALGIINMVFETVGMLAIFCARMKGVKDIVLIGNLTALSQAETLFDKLSEMFNVNILIPDKAAYGTVIGAALEAIEKE
ncbi:MAG: type II pantothenate kinase [Clostridia bacterium]|nr:type II pantothenate kinase [Clostridia bacterium]